MSFKKAILCAVSLFFVMVSTLAATEIADMGDEISTHPTGIPIALRGADLDESVSRIVIDGIPEGGYKLKPANNKLHFLFSNFQWNFLKDDLSSLRFLKNVKKFTMLEHEEHTVFTIIYDCNCQADVYKWKGQKIVIDIFGLEAVGNPTKTARWIEKQKTALETQEKSYKSIHKANMDIDGQNAEKKKSAELAQKNNSEKTLKKTGNSFQDQLQSLLAAAESQGVVDFKEGSDIFKISENKPEPEPAPEPQEAEAAQKVSEDDPLYFSQVKSSAPALALEKKSWNNRNSKLSGRQKVNNNVSVSGQNIITNDDIQQLLPGDQNMFRGAKKRCLPDGAFILPTNDPRTETFYDDLTEYRSQVVGEFDKTHPEMSLKLAHHYISYGLGEEALNTMNNFGAPEHRGFIAKSMAELLTSASPTSDTMFALKRDCTGVHGLWSAYYYYRIGNEKRAATLSDYPEAVESLATLPIVLRRHIGSALALNLVRKGSYKMAESMVDEIAKTTSQFDHSVLLVRGLIDAKNGFAERALATLENVMTRTTGLDQQMAGLSLSELKLAMNAPLNERDMSALEELVFLKAREYVGAQALALIAEHESRFGNFYKGFKRLSKNLYKQEGVKDPVMIKAEQIFRRLAISGEGVDNPDNLRIYYEFGHLMPDDPALHIGFAKQLYQLGHDAPAYDIMSETRSIHPDYFKKNDQSYFMGEILFRMGRYKDVVKVMDQPFDKDLEYMTLKSEAMSQIGQYQEAYMLLKSFEDPISDRSRARYALEAKEWHAAKEAYEDAALDEDNPNDYFSAKASGYMGGHDYPGHAAQYENDVDVIFHQSEKQASGIEDIVKETDHLINLINERYKTVQPLTKIEEKPEILKDG